METRVTTLETRFDTILPTLATKADVQKLETRFDTILPTLATKADLKSLETRFDTILPTLATKVDLINLKFELTGTIHQEISLIHKEFQSLRTEMNSNNWRMIIWVTTVIGMAITGVYYIARV